MTETYENYMEDNLIGFGGVLGEYFPLVVGILGCLAVSILLVKSVKALMMLVKAQRTPDDIYTYQSRESGASSDISGDYRVVNGFLVKLNMEAQENYMPGRGGYEKARDVGNIRSVIFRDASGLQKLLDEKAGTGDFVAANKEKVNFGVPIGQYMDPSTGGKVETMIGVIHYTVDGVFIVPARPDNNTRR